MSVNMSKVPEEYEERLEEKHTQVHVFSTAPRELSKTLPQYMAATAANFGTMAAGSCLGWTSPALPKVDDSESGQLEPGRLPLSFLERSLTGSFLPLGAALGPFIAGFLADRLGRKNTILLSAPVFLLSWVLLLFSQSAPFIIFARLIQGIAVGIIFTVVPMYVGEISEDHIRGALGSFLQLLICFGILYEYAIGPYVTYKTLVVLSGALPIVFAGAFFFVPETPYHLVAKGKRREAISSLQWLRGQSSESVQMELDNIQNEMDEIRQKKSQLRDLWSTRGNIKALCLSLGLVAFQQLCGIDAVLFNAQTIFTSTGSTLDPAVATILVGVVMFIASGCTPLVVERFGNRFLLLLSGIVMAVSLGVLGAFLSYQESGADISSFGWLPVASLLVYIIAHSIGFGPLPWAVLGELFPSNVKSNASALTASFCWSICFLITLFYGDLDRLLGTHWAFWIFSIFCCLASVFVYSLLPETRGRSLQEIHDLLNR